MAHVLRMTAAEMGDPVTCFVLVKGLDLAVHLSAAVRDRRGLCKLTVRRWLR